MCSSCSKSLDSQSTTFVNLNGINPMYPMNFWGIKYSSIEQLNVGHHNVISSKYPTSTQNMWDVDHPHVDKMDGCDVDYPEIDPRMP